MGDQVFWVHFAEDEEAQKLEYLRTLLEPGIRVTSGQEMDEPPAYQALVFGELTREALVASPKLTAAIQPYTGVAPETRELMREFPHVTLYNSHGPALPTAEMAFALLLAAAKHLLPLDRALRRDDWSPRYRPFPTVLLAGKTALILGYGAIGECVSRMCHGFGVRVLATRRSGEKDPNGLAEVFPQEAMHSLLPRADFVIVCLPLTDETEGLIGQRELSLLPPDAVLVNVGRGPIVDQGALFRALKEGRLGAAGLDVWYNYPDDEGSVATPPSDFPFGELDNVVLSPHRGGLAREEDARRGRMAALAEIIVPLARGEPAPNRVDLARGY